jgi:hypothetical protein
VFTTAHQWCLSWARWIQSTTSHSVSLKSILILSSHLRLGLPSGVFPSDFPTEILYEYHLSHSCYMTSQSHIPSLVHPDKVCTLRISRSVCRDAPWNRPRLPLFKSLFTHNLYPFSHLILRFMVFAA